MAMGGVRMW